MPWATQGWHSPTSARWPAGEYRLLRGDLEAIAPGGAVPDCLALWVPGTEATAEDGRWLASRFPGRLWLAVELHSGPDDAGELSRLQALAAAAGCPWWRPATCTCTPAPAVRCRTR